MNFSQALPLYNSNVRKELFRNFSRHLLRVLMSLTSSKSRHNFGNLTMRLLAGNNSQIVIFHVKNFLLFIFTFYFLKEFSFS